MSKPMPNAACAGFTLTELVMVMSIVAILAAIGIPSFKYVTTSNRIASEINGLLGDMQFARSEAIKQGLPVTVCSSTDGANCNGGNTWRVGWIVFLDSNPAGTTGTRDAGEAILRTQNGFKSTDTLVPAAGNFSAITFNRLGYGATGNAGTVTLELHDSTATAQWTRCVAITPVGMLSTQRAATGSCT